MMEPGLSLGESAEKHGLKASDDGRRITGIVKGFPIYAEMSPFEGSKSVVVTVRLRSFEDVKGFRAAVEDSALLDATRLKFDMKRDCVDYDLLILQGTEGWDIFDDKGEVMELLRLAKQYLGKPRVVCERCGSTDVRWPIVDGRVPLLLCDDCAGARVKDRGGLKEMHGVVLHSYGRGVKLGVIGAVAGGAIAPILGCLAGMSNPKIYPILIGAVIPYLVKRGVGMVNSYVYLISAGLAILSIFIERVVLCLLLGDSLTAAIMGFVIGIQYSFYGRLFFLLLPIVTCAITLLVLKWLARKIEGNIS
ncbi:MAG: hypothetical protein JW984_08300 [Deltaproteobacteria bacterium]|uniref:Uncharacterized protein n=1 Tax=Candidatus Zymogenus saltonus TaxID=2844893 RepID=A0A9D8KFG0_9DELT|nr:hypothetical protein [Candidatus Zymogenus saltonus]